MQNLVILVIVLIIFTLFILGLSFYLVFLHPGRKWKCVEGRCELDINGKYSSESDCINSCKPKEMNAWACNSDYQCVKSDQGYTSEELCKKNCNNNVYYPQSLYTDLPVRWGGRWGGWGRWGGGRRWFWRR